MTAQVSPHTPYNWVLCLCAQWCGTCRSYDAVFAAAHAQFPDTVWKWVDVEELADLIDPLELENFPTLLVARGKQATFFGPITPQAETLHRLLQAKLAPDAPQLNDQDANGLLQRLQAHFS